MVREEQIEEVKKDIKVNLENMRSHKEEKIKLQKSIDNLEREYNKQNIQDADPMKQELMVNLLSRQLKELISRLNNTKNFLSRI